MKRTALMAAILLSAAAACVAPPRTTESDAAVRPADTLRAVSFGPTFRDARAVALDPQGRFYVADAGADVVQQLASEGQPLTTLGGPGSGAYAFLGPAGVDPTNGLVLYVADSGNGRVQRFSHEGRLLESIVVPADPEQMLGRGLEDVERGRPLAVTAAPSGELYVVEALRGVVLLYDERRSLVRVVGGSEEGRGALRQPVALALTHDGRLLVADAALRSILVYDVYGGFLRRIADGSARDVRAIATGRERIHVVLPDRILTYGRDGEIAEVLAVEVPEPLVGGAVRGDELVLLTASSLWKASR